MSKRSYEAWQMTGILEAGIGHVIICRHKGSGDTEAGVFLVDTACLGVKDAFFTVVPAKGVAPLVERVFGDNGSEQVSPACARKLVEDSVVYAAKLGLAPHVDYKKAARVLGGIDAQECQAVFTFGHEGKPLYVQGPYDSPAFVQRVLHALHSRCGEGNYHYILDAGSEVTEE
jgi:hypothetical protein